MFTRIFIAFVIVAGLAYYFNVDVREIVEKSGVPQWLSSRGVQVHSTSTMATTTP